MLTCLHLGWVQLTLRHRFLAYWFQLLRVTNFKSLRVHFSSLKKNKVSPPYPVLWMSKTPLGSERMTRWGKHEGVMDRSCFILFGGRGMVSQNLETQAKNLGLEGYVICSVGCNWGCLNLWQWILSDVAAHDIYQLPLTIWLAKGY